MNAIWAQTAREINNEVSIQKLAQLTGKSPDYYRNQTKNMTEYIKLGQPCGKSINGYLTWSMKQGINK